MRALLLALAALIVASPIAAQPATPAATGPVCRVGTCTDGPGEWLYPDGSVYHGPFVGGQPNGEGTATLADGTVAVGTFVDGVMNGPIVARYADGQRFEGTIVGGDRAGEGTHTYVDGATWTGSWLHGWGVDGVLRGADGREISRGPFPGGRTADPGFTCVTGDCQDGTGTGTWPDGMRYTGAWRAGLRHGRGQTVSADGDIAEGTFEHGRLTGPGVYRYEGGGLMPAGARYQGTFRAGMRDGTGTLTLPDSPPGAGGTYTGEWRDDLRHGHGRYVRASGFSYEGDFVDDKALGQGRIRYPEGGTYEGAVRDDQPNGEGTSTFPDGGRYTGTHVEEKVDGQGVYTYPSGATYTGAFRQGVRTGEGTLHWPNGVSWTGTWTADVGDGEGQYADATGAPLYRAPFSFEWTPAQPDACLAGDCVEGVGQFRYSDGTAYDGAFRHGLRHGAGRYTISSGAMWTGTFANDAFAPGQPAAIALTNGAQYHGTVDGQGNPEGEGTYTYADGRTWTGRWSAGNGEGDGAYSRADGAVYTRAPFSQTAPPAP